jgi:glycosyltransferase involved in cell wall biosynthesis
LINTNKNKRPKIFATLPALNESENIRQFIRDIMMQDYAEWNLIVCVNQPEEWWDSPEKVSVCHDNALTLNYLQGINDKRIFLLDRSSKGNGWIGKRHGVGWARKTAMDFACTMAGNTDIILTLDADTHYPSNYFDSVINALESYPDATGLQAPYYHNLTGNEQADCAILRYEIYMRSYAINLMAIRNPYCFSAIGSGMACSVEVYKRVGGLTPKMSGEDFYFIQKLRKAGRVIINCETVVNPAARFSDRVYFGTGPAMIRGKDGNWDSYPIYSMESFKKIADTYALFPLLYEKDIPVALDEFLLQWSGGSSFWEPLRLNSSNVDAFVKACMQRFDGLRILQFLKADNKNYKTTDEEKLKELLGSKLFSDIEKPDVSNVKDFEKLSVDEMNMLRDLLTEKERKLQRHIKLA